MLLFTKTKIFNNILSPFIVVPRQQFSFLSNFITNRQTKDSTQKFKSQIQYLANKPTFTLKDYKARIDDDLIKMKNKITAKLNSQSQQHKKNLITQQKVLASLFQQELNSQNNVKFDIKKQISLVTKIDIQQVIKTLGKFQQYKQTHAILRDLRLRNEPLPENQEELKQALINNPISRDNNKKMKYMRYKQPTQAKRRKYHKSNYDNGYQF